MTASRATLKSFFSDHPATPRDDRLTRLLDVLGTASAEIAALVRHGALTGDLGAIVGKNVQEEGQKALDVRANDILIAHLRASGLAAGVASEELEDPVIFDAPDSPFLVIFDPLDGSSNIEINGPVGTIFSVLPAPLGRQPESADFLKPGSQQVAAGYVLYGPSALMVVTAGTGAHAFTLNPDSATFLLTEEALAVPRAAQEFAINASNRRFWEAPIVRYIDDCLAGADGPRGRNFNMRWVAAMVADVHRAISRGGVFLYPLDDKTRDKGGRLRLMYEANPMAMIVEQAGGAASTGTERLLDVVPSGLHQRIPVVIGSADEVKAVEDYYR